MSDQHLTVGELLEAAKAGPFSKQAAHLRDCPRCASLIDRIKPQQMVDGDSLSVNEPRMETPDRYSAVFEKVVDSISAESSELDRQRDSADNLRVELESLDPRQRQLLIRNSQRFRSWPLVESLLEAAQAGWTEDSVRAEFLATIACEVLDCLQGTGFRRKLLNDLKAEAWSYIGNARRIRSDLRGAERAFGVAKLFLDSGTSDPMERARFFDLRSSLARANRDFKSAEKLLAIAIRLYREANDQHFECRALMNQARLLFETGAVQESIESMKRAGGLIDPQSDPWLYFLHKKNLVVYLTEAGRAGEARALLPEVRALAREHGNRYERLRLLWTEGLVCSSLGQVEMAEEALKQVREGFIDAGIGYDVALVSLDLAALYLEQGRTAEVKTLGAETIPQFLARNIDREALAAIALFQEAARRERATLALVRDTAERIKTARSRPDRPD